MNKPDKRVSRVLSPQLIKSAGGGHLSRARIAPGLKRVSHAYVLASKGTCRITPAEHALLAADRVYLPMQSPAQTVGSYPTRFTIPSFLLRKFRFCGTFPEVTFGCR